MKQKTGTGRPAKARPTGRSIWEQELSRRIFLSRSAAVGGVALSSTALGSVLAACGGDSAGGTPTRGGTLLAAISGDPDVLDPAISPAYNASEVFNHVFQKLVTTAPNGSIEAELAVSWDAPDARTWVFELRDDVAFHNGEQFTADDVKYTFERILDPKTASAYTTNFADIDTVEVVSPTEVVFHLKRPFAPFLTTLANNGQIVNQQAIEEGNPEREPVGTGPFEFAEWARGDHITLKRFSDFWDNKLPYADELVITFMPATPRSIDALRAGEQNYLDSIPAQSLQTAAGDSAFNYVTADNAGLPQMLAFKLDREPVNNQALRQAIAWAIDREAVNEVAFFGDGQVGSEEVPDGSPWYDGEDPYLAGPDLDRARSLIAKSGLSTPIEIEFLAWTAQDYPTRVGEVIRDQLRAVDIDLKVTPIELSPWLDRLIGGDYEMTLVFNERTIDPDNLFSLMLTTDASQNFWGYSNSEVDKLIAKAKREPDDDVRNETYTQVRQLVFDDLPLHHMHYATPNYLMQSDVVGATIRPNLELRLDLVGFSES